MGERKCWRCDRVIPAERVEALPETSQCVECAAKFPDRVFHDPNVLCAQASASARNGFAPSE